MNDYEKYDNFESEDVKVLWYSAEKENLIVEYKDGKQSRYDNISNFEWQSLKGSESKGKFINENIKSKPYQKMMLHD